MILYSKWLDLPITTRIKIAEQFGIVKRGSTEVFNNTIKSDGFLIKEIETALAVGALQNYVDEPKETDLVVLWNLMLNKINGIPKVKKEQKSEIPVTEPIIAADSIAPEKPVKEESHLSKVIKANAKPKKTK